MSERETLGDCRTAGRFKVGDRVWYKNFDGVLSPGTVTRVQRNGYRIDWDDGYKDLSGAAGVYRDDEFAGEDDA